MREHGVHQLFFRGLEIHRDHITLDQLGDLGADHMRAEELARFFVENHLDQSLILAKRDGLAVADEWKAADANVELLVLGRLFGESDRSDLRRAIRASWNQEFIHRVRMQALDGLDANHAFVLGFVRQKRRAGDIADGVDSRYAGFAHAIDDNSATVGFHSELFQAKVLDIADDPNGRDDALDRKRLGPALAVIDRRGDAVRFFIELGHFGAGEDLDALFLEALARESGDLGIFDGQDPRQHLDNGHFRAERTVERSEFDSDRARTDNKKRFWYPIRDHRFEIGPHQFSVGFDAGQHPRPRAGGDNDVFGRIGSGAERALGRFAATGLDRDFSGRVDRRLSPDYGNLVFLHEKADAVVEPLGDVARSFDDSAGIVGHLASRQSVGLGMLEVV